MSRLHIGKYEFDNEEEYYKARQEATLVESIKSKYDLNDPLVVGVILEKFIPESIVGREFIDVIGKDTKNESDNSDKSPTPIIYTDDNAQIETLRSNSPSITKSVIRLLYRLFRLTKRLVILVGIIWLFLWCRSKFNKFMDELKETGTQPVKLEENEEPVASEPIITQKPTPNPKQMNTEKELKNEISADTPPIGVISSMEDEDDNYNDTVRVQHEFEDTTEESSITQMDIDNTEDISEYIFMSYLDLYDRIDESRFASNGNGYTQTIDRENPQFFLDQFDHYVQKIVLSKEYTGYEKYDAYGIRIGDDRKTVNSILTKQKGHLQKEYQGKAGGTHYDFALDNGFWISIDFDNYDEVHMITIEMK